MRLKDASIDFDSFTVSSMGFSVLETKPDHPIKLQPWDGVAVNWIVLPEVYSVVVLPADIIFSETVPDPVIETVRGYFLFSKFDVMVWFEFTVTESGLSVEPFDQLTKTYSESGVAVIETLDPDSKDPPELETFPPVEDVTVKLNVMTDSTVSGESFPQERIDNRISELKINLIE